MTAVASGSGSGPSDVAARCFTEPLRGSTGSALKTTGMPSAPASPRSAATFSTRSRTGELPAGNASMNWFCMPWTSSAVRSGAMVQATCDAGREERSGMGYDSMAGRPMDALLPVRRAGVCPAPPDVLISLA